MARKPTRFWHPATRMLRNARERARTLVTTRDESVQLDDVRTRLQHYLRAIYGESVPIEPLTDLAKSSWATRTLTRLSLARAKSVSESDAVCIRLPASLEKMNGAVSPLEQYRVMAVQHAERMRRGSASRARDVTTDLERDLYQLAESAAIDAAIIASQPGLRAAITAARAEAMAQRGTPRFQTAIEARVEEMVRGAFQSSNSPALPIENDAEANATWARRTAVELEVKFGRKAAKEYRRVQDITLWQTSVNAQLSEEQQHALQTELKQAEFSRPPDPWDSSSRSLIPGAARSQSAENKSGTRPKKADAGDQSADKDAQGGRGNTDEADPNDGDSKESDEDTGSQGNKGKDSADSATEQSANAPGERGSDAQIAHSGDAVDDTAIIEGITFRYPEWDFTRNKFNDAGTIVRVVPSTLESAAWAMNALQENAREVQRAKRQFERLRSHRLRLRRQVQGEELDLEACVEAMVDRSMGIAPTDRLYSHVRPGRRELAITLLIDISGSTGKDVPGEQRVIDLERIAALVASSAFDALGDQYSILAFSSAGPANVRVHTLKEFNEVSSSVVLQRISALEPHGTTRLGAAVRHAAATLSKHPAPHRLLLILSDGKPSDYDWYFTDYAIQDTRQAIVQARLDGIHPFCITVDTADDEAYLPEIFGTAGYRVVSRPSQLSQALLQAVQRMIGGN